MDVVHVSEMSDSFKKIVWLVVSNAIDVDKSQCEGYMRTYVVAHPVKYSIANLAGDVVGRITRCFVKKNFRDYFDNELNSYCWYMSEDRLRVFFFSKEDGYCYRVKLLEPLTVKTIETYGLVFKDWEAYKQAEQACYDYMHWKEFREASSEHYDMEEREYEESD